MKTLYSDNCKNCTRFPLIRHWNNGRRPLPKRVIRPTSKRRFFPFFRSTPPWLYSGEHNRPFDFCARLAALCTHIAEHCPTFQHIDTSRVLFGVTQSRNGRAHGLQARVTPLRFPGGELRMRRRGVTYQVQRYIYEEIEFLYLVTFCLPRFLDQDFDDKLVTLFHELYHISPDFNGDLRRHKGRYAIHTHSQKKYDQHMAELAKEYLAGNPDPALTDFLRMDFAQLHQRHGGVLGIMVPRPKIIPVVVR